MNADKEKTSEMKNAAAAATVDSSSVSADPAVTICLKPSSTDYATFIKTTKKAMGLSEEECSKTKPDMRVLALAGLASDRYLSDSDE